jgi:hypothetical protein
MLRIRKYALVRFFVDPVHFSGIFDSIFLAVQIIILRGTEGETTKKVLNKYVGIFFLFSLHYLHEGWYPPAKNLLILSTAGG